MDFDESEWVIADANEAAADVVTGIAGDWVLADGPEGSISGVFFRRRRGRRCAPSYAAFGRRGQSADRSLSFLPPSVSVKSSSRGLLLLRGPWSAYYVCNPATAECRRIPRPLRPHHPSSVAPIALALVSRPDKPSSFHLVCAFEVPGDGRLRFETFSSHSGKWWESASGQSGVSVGRVVPGSGVSAGGVAFWRTESPQGIIAYDPEADEARTLAPPPGVETADGRWQLGEAGGGDSGLGRLCCACVTGSRVVAHGLGPSDQWTVLGSVDVAVIAGDDDDSDGSDAASWGVADDAIVCREPPWPLRFESANLELVLWVDGRLVAVDLESRWVREVRVDGPVPAAPDGDYVAHINTLVPVGST